MPMEIIFTIVIILITGINCYILKRSGISIKDNMLLLILIFIGLINFGVFAYHSFKIGGVALTNGYIENGKYFVAFKQMVTGASLQVSQWDYNFNIIISKCLIGTFPIAFFSSLLMLSKLSKSRKNGKLLSNKLK